MADSLIQLLTPSYLYHGLGGASFCPLSLLTFLPSSAGEFLDPSHPAAHVHEQAHYFQAMTTLTGLDRLSGWWRIISNVADLLTRERLRLPNDPGPAELRDLYVAYMDVQNDLSEILHITPVLSGPQRIAADDRSMAGFAVPRTDDALFFCYGAHTLQESMAMAMEVWREVDCGNYEWAARSSNHAFRYAAASETIAQTLGGRGRDLWWLTIMLCDLALDRIAPHLVFWQMLEHLRERGPGLPPFAAMPELHTELLALTHIDEVEEDRSQLLGAADHWAERGHTSGDPFDQAIGRLFERAGAGLRRRLADPTKLLHDYLTAPVASGLLDEFALPLYVSGTRLISQTEDERLRDAVMFLHLASHRAQVQLGVYNTLQCPFATVPGACDFVRVDACSTAPWTRAEEAKQACAYRYVAHSLAHAMVHADDEERSPHGY